MTMTAPHLRRGLSALVATAGLLASQTGIEHAPAASCSALIRNIGAAGLLAVPGANGAELVVGASTGSSRGNDYWLVLRHAASGRYDEVFASPIAQTEFDALLLGDVDPMSGPELLVVFANGGVQVWNLPARRLLRSFQAPVSRGFDLLAAALRDLDGDGAPELIVGSTTDDLKVYRLDGTLSWTAPARPRQLVVGQMDNDAALEIACSDGKVIDAQTHAVERDFATDLGALAAADIDTDGRDELVASGTGQTRFYDVETGTMAFSLPWWGEHVLVKDVTGDNQLDLVADNYLSGMQVFDIASRQATWPQPATASGALAAADFDGDGLIEVMTAEGRQVSPPRDQLLVFDGATGTAGSGLPARLDGPFEHLRLCELDGDATPEVLVQSSGRYAAQLVLSADSLAIESIPPQLFGDCDTHDLDGDGKDEVISPANGISIHGITAAAGWQQLRSLNRVTENWTTVRVADLDGDQQPEILAQDSLQLYCFDSISGQEVGRTPFFVPQPVRMFIADSDGDGVVDVHLLSRGSVYVFRGPQLQVTAVLQPVPGTAFVSVTGVDLGAGVQALLLGDDHGDATVLLPTPGRPPLASLSLTAPAPLRSQTLFATPFLWLVGDGSRMRGIADPVSILIGSPQPFWSTDRRGAGLGNQHALWFERASLLTTSSAGVFRYLLR